LDRGVLQNMGVGVSSLRLRKALVIRAYNLRAGDETLEEQFREFSHIGAEGKMYLCLDDVKRYLGFVDGTGSEAKSLERLLSGSLVGKEIPYEEFVEFLETGAVNRYVVGVLL